MDKSKKQGLILGSLIVVMFVVYGRNLVSNSSSEESNAPDSVSQDESADASFSTHVNLLVYPVSGEALIRVRKKQHQRMESIVWSRDPFMSGSMDASLTGLSLSGIIWDPTNPMAIINEQLVHVGDRVEMYQIVIISQDEVSVSDGIEIFKLKTAP